MRAWWVEHIDALIPVCVGVILLFEAWRLFRKNDPPTGPRTRTIDTLLTVAAVAVVLGAFRLVWRTDTAAAQWQDFTGDGSFSVSLPETPVSSEHLKNTEVGPVRVYSFFAYGRTDGTQYWIRYSELPEGHVYGKGDGGDLRPDAAAIESRGFKARSSTLNKVSGFPGALIDGEASGSPIKLQFVWAGGREYLLTRISRPGVTSGNDRFFDSFRVVPK